MGINDHLTLTREENPVGLRLSLTGRRGAVSAQLYTNFPEMGVEMTVHHPKPRFGETEPFQCELVPGGKCYPDAGTLRQSNPSEAEICLAMENWYLQHCYQAG